jgi:hypothetical protein
MRLEPAPTAVRLKELLAATDGSVRLTFEVNQNQEVELKP